MMKMEFDGGRDAIAMKEMMMKRMAMTGMMTKEVEVKTMILIMIRMMTKKMLIRRWWCGHTSLAAENWPPHTTSQIFRSALFL